MPRSDTFQVTRLLHGNETYPALNANQQLTHNCSLICPGFYSAFSEEPLSCETPHRLHR